MNQQVIEQNKLSKEVLKLLKKEYPINIDKYLELFGLNNEDIIFAIDNNILSGDKQKISSSRRLKCEFLFLALKFPEKIILKKEKIIETSTFDLYNAYYFSQAFLMPEDEFLKICKNNRIKNQFEIKKIANYFDVQVSFALSRGRHLGIFSWF